MQLCANGSVTDLVRAMHDEGATLSEDIISYLLKEVLSGLSFLHSQHYMHRDVKGQNCLLTAHGRVKLVDFGELRAARVQTALTYSFKISVAFGYTCTYRHAHTDMNTHTHTHTHARAHARTHKCKCIQTV